MFISVFFAVEWSLWSPVQQIWKNILTSKALRLWGWEWVQESKLKESRFMFDIIIKWSFENESNEWWCLTKYPETLRNESKNELSDPTRNEMYFQNEKTSKIKKYLCFFSFSFHFFSFRRSGPKRKFIFFILEIWSDMKVLFFLHLAMRQILWKHRNYIFQFRKSGKNCNFNIVPSVFVFL